MQNPCKKYCVKLYNKAFQVNFINRHSLNTLLTTPIVRCLNNGFMVIWQGWFSILSLPNFVFPDAFVFMLIIAQRKRPITCGNFFFKRNNSILTFMFCIEFAFLIYNKRKYYKAWNSVLSRSVAVIMNLCCENECASSKLLE